MVRLLPQKNVPGPDAGSESFVGGIVQAGPLAVGGLISNVLNVVATVVVARLLTTSQYGGIAQLLGLYFVLSMPGASLLVGAVRRITGLVARRHHAEARSWTSGLYRKAVIGVVAWSVISVLTQSWLSKTLGLHHDGAAVAFTMIAAGVWVLLCIDRAILQSHQRYGGLGVSLVVEIGVRTVLVLSFAELGWGIRGYALGLLLGEVAAAAQARLSAREAWVPASGAVAGTAGQAGQPPFGRPDPVATAGALSVDLGAALSGFALLGVLQNADIILVGRLDHANSGAYAAISVASKALVFGAILLGSHILPEASIRWHRGEHALRQLGVTMVFLLVPVALLLLVALAVPKQFLSVFFGARLDRGAPAFALLAGAMACLSTTVVLTNYLLGVARRWVVALLGAGMVILVVLIHGAHGAIMATARAELVVQGGLVVVVMVAFAVVHQRIGDSSPQGEGA